MECQYLIVDNKGYFNCLKHDGSVGLCNLCLNQIRLSGSGCGSITYLLRDRERKWFRSSRKVWWLYACKA